MAYGERRNNKLTGRWVCDAEYKNTDGSVDRWHKAFASKQEAEGAEAYFRATGQKPPHLVAGPASDSFEVVAERFKSKHPSWFTGRNGAVNQQRFEFVVGVLGKLPVTAVRRRQLEDLVEQIEKRCGRAGQPPANATINRYLDAAGKVLGYAHQLELIAGRPSFPRRDNNAGAKRGALTWAQEDAICGWMEAHGLSTEAFLIRALAASGMRAGELDCITASQIETPEQVEYTGLQLRGDQTKNGHPRWVPLVPECAKKLKAIIAAGRRTKQHILASKLKRAVKALGENPKISPHWLRHTFNTRANDVHPNHLDVAEIVGHLEGAMSQLYYHPNKPKLYSVIEKMPNRFGEIRKTGEVVRFNPKDAQEQVLATAINS